MRAGIAVLAVVVGGSLSAAPTEYQNLIPEPRHIHVTGEQWIVAEGGAPTATLVIAPRQEQARIGADEINGRIAFLEGPALPVVEAGRASDLDAIEGLPIIIANCYGSDLVKAVIAKGLDITRDDPGQQGYVIRFPDFRGRRLVFLCGSDRMGTLYAAVTFRWLLEREGDDILATVCSVRDWPDFKWRGTSSFQQIRGTYPVYASPEPVEQMKRHIDWMLRRKLNFCGDYFYGGQKVPALEVGAWMREINAYARDRGMMGEEYQSTNVGYDERDADDPRFQAMQHLSDKFFSWSDDELLRKRAREVAEFYDAAGLDCLVLHPQDGGGPTDPELWSQRSEADRERWGDDRAAADAHVFNIFYEEARRLNPRMTVVYVIYPYNAVYLDWDSLKQRWPDLTREQFEENGRRYFERIATLIPEDVHICIWQGEPKYMDQLRAIYGDRPVYYWWLHSYGWTNSGWMVTTPRYMGANFYDNPGDIMACRIDRNAPNFINRALCAQFAWNTRSQGATDFDGYYDFLRDNDEPRFIIDRWGLTACRNMWGSEAGPVVFQALSRGVIPAMIVQPSLVLDRPNRDRRRRGQPPLELTPEMMLRQAKGCEAGAKALDQVLDMDVQLEDLAERLFVYYLRRAHSLAPYARAHYHLLLANQGVAAGDEGKVRQNVAAGIAALDAGLQDMERVLGITADMKPMDRKYPRTAEGGVFPAIPNGDLDFPRMRESLDACLRRYADSLVEFEPIKHEGPIRVAIYDPATDGGSATGHQGWMMTLEQAEGIEAEYVDDLGLSNLVNYEVLLYPQCNSGRSVGRYEFFEVLRRYVEEAGGGVMFGHHAVGYERAEFGMDTTFPRVGLGATDRLDSNRVVVAAEHPITAGFEVGAEGEHPYYDHFIVKPGAKGTVVLKDPEGGAVMVAGQEKRGRVIYDGSIMLTQDNQPVAAEGFWRDILLNAIRWLAQRS